MKTIKLDDLFTLLDKVSTYNGIGLEPVAAISEIKELAHTLSSAAHLYTLDEVRAIHNSLPLDCFLELTTARDRPSIIMAITVTGVGPKGISFHFGYEEYTKYNDAVYGWRLWSARPTEEEMRAAAWEDE